jgi:hypothetical protein
MDWAEQQLEILRKNYPNWDLWVVRRYVGGPLWCAKPKGASIALLHANEPEHLVGYIAEAEAQDD